MSESTSGNTTQQFDSLVSKKIALPIEILLIIAAGIGLAVSSPTVTVGMLALWVALTLAYVGMAVRRLMIAVGSHDQNRDLLPEDSPTKGTRGGSFHFDVVAIGFASAMGMISAITVSSGDAEGIYGVLATILAPMSIVLAWTLMQFGFCRLYADTWFKEKDGGGIKFPEQDEPGIVEFTYFAFSVGAALQTPDTAVTTARMRMLVTIHTIIAFLYGSVLIAFIVSTIPAG